MRTMLVEVTNIRPADVVEMSQAEAQEVIEAFSLQGTDPCFGKGVGIRRQRWRTQAADVRVFEHVAKPGRVLTVAIVDQEARLQLFLIKPYQCIPRLLLHPAIVRMIRCRTEKHPSRSGVDEREAVCRASAHRRDDALGEEVAGDERVHVKPDEVFPLRLPGSPSPRRRRRQPFVLQDPPDCRAAELQPKLAQFANDAPVTPAVVILRQPNDDLSHVADYSRSTDSLRLPPFPLLHHPARIGLRRDDAYNVGHVMIEFPADCQQARPILRTGNDAVAIELATEDFNLGNQESHAGITQSSHGLVKQVRKDVEPAKNNQSPSNTNQRCQDF